MQKNKLHAVNNVYILLSCIVLAIWIALLHRFNQLEPVHLVRNLLEFRTFNTERSVLQRDDDPSYDEVEHRHRLME